ncbi:adenosine deaminase CECR1 [Fopius arisanus]|uniref:Adenosine deaminase n=2 Tax=Fopius arisanus TaxID=64838 RepID=A0A9R1SXQ6_9HYME|nr:PREDICTED: adenosine deaminase CECR1-like [Fopius arisanus]
MIIARILILLPLVSANKPQFPLGIAVYANPEFDICHRDMRAVMETRDLKFFNSVIDKTRIYSWPLKNFKSDIESLHNSPLFQLVRKMPKGAALHIHHKAMVNTDWLYLQTYRTNLYVCDKHNHLSLKFFKTPSNDCNWQALYERRRNPLVRQVLEDRIRRQMTMLTEIPDRSDTNVLWEKFQNIFTFLRSFLNYRPLAEDHFYQGLLELYEDNVMYVEVRSGLQKLYDLDGKIYTTTETVNILHDVVTRFKADHPDFIGAKIIYAKSRDMDHDELRSFLHETVELKKMFPGFIAGADLVGHEDAGYKLKDHSSLLLEVSNWTDFFFHAGETQNFLLQPTNLQIAIRHNAKRIGHAYSITKEPDTLRELKEKNIPVEVCPISNQVLGLVSNLRNHQAAILFALDIPVVISNDDPGLWGAKGLSDDFYMTLMSILPMNANLYSLKKIARNSIIYSTLSENEKAAALDSYEKRWQQFLINVTMPFCDYTQVMYSWLTLDRNTW